MTSRQTAAIGGTIAALVVIIGVSVQAFLSLRDVVQASMLADRTQAALLEVEGLHTALAEAQSGLRYFLISGDDGFLITSYPDTLDRISFRLGRLREVVDGSAEMNDLLDQLDPLVAARLDHISAQIEQRRASGPEHRIDEAALVAGRLEMDRVRGLLSQLRYAAALRYAAQRGSVNSTAEFAGIALVVGVAMALVTIVLILLLMQREARRRLASEAELREVNAALDLRVADRTSELEGANADLERQIAERQSAEERLRLSEERYRSVVELIQEAIWIHCGGRLVFANAHAVRIFGAASLDDLIGLPVVELIAEEDRPRAAERTRALTEDRLPAELTEMLLLRRDGAPFHAEIQAVPFMHDGKPAVLAAARDVSERRLLQAQLHQAQKMESLGQLTGGIAHDFNNLLAIVVGNVELLTEELDPDDRRAEMARAALTGALRGAELTNQLLTFSRRHELTLARVDVAALIAGLRSILQRTLGERVLVRLQVADDLWPVRTDSAQLESSLLNMAINARDAMPDGGMLTIEATNCSLDEHYAALHPGLAAGEYVMLAVTDTGAGMPPDVLARVFEPFFTTKSAGKGTGLGLSMVYGFAKQSGGHISIYSEVGEGTTVRLYLPRLVGDETVADAPADEASTAGEGETILVVEDNPDVRAVAVGQLGRLGYSVMEAENGNAGLAVVETGAHIDLLFTDIVMAGGMSGPELARAARGLRPDLKVLFTTGFADITQNGGLIGAGDRILRKPYRLVDLGRAIRDALADTD